MVLYVTIATHEIICNLLFIETGETDRISLVPGSGTIVHSDHIIRWVKCGFWVKKSCWMALHLFMFCLCFKLLSRCCCSTQGLSQYIWNKDLTKQARKLNPPFRVHWILCNSLRDRLSLLCFQLTDFQGVVKRPGFLYSVLGQWRVSGHLVDCDEVN